MGSELIIASRIHVTFFAKKERVGLEGYLRLWLRIFFVEGRDELDRKRLLGWGGDAWLTHVLYSYVLLGHHTCPHIIRSSCRRDGKREGRVNRRHVFHKWGSFWGISAVGLICTAVEVETKIRSTDTPDLYMILRRIPT